MAPLDLSELGSALHDTFPTLPTITPVRVLGAGFRNITVETAEGLVFRIGRDEAAIAGHQMEARLLPALAPHVPVDIPHPSWPAGPSPHFPFGVLGYPMLSGAPLAPQFLTDASLEGLAGAVANFILALHRFPVAEALACGVLEPQERWARLGRMRDVILPALHSVLSAGEYARIVRWWEDFLADDTLRSATSVLCHNDLWYENLLIDPNAATLVGVVDFENAALADPAQDFATQMHLSRRFTARVIAAYRAAGGALGKSFFHRLRRHWELREFDGLYFALKAADAAETADAIRKLRTGPLFNHVAS
jgi:aminoglycoside phosphotransferase (APT) family kinase protein